MRPPSPFPLPSMISLHRNSDSSRLHAMKAAYLRSLVAPMDGMWESGLIPRAPHWEIHLDDHLTGFCVITDEGALLQLHLRPECQAAAKGVLDFLRSEHGVRKAVVSTVDPWFLSFALDRHESVTVHTLMYDLPGSPAPSSTDASKPDLVRLDPESLDAAVDLQVACLAGNEALREWLLDYSGRLITRGELLLLRSDEAWLGLGEFRRSETQPGVVDVGMMVSPGHRRQGWATEILRRLARQALDEGLRPICSTTVDNIASRTAIERAGFVPRHRILDVCFE